MNPNQKLFNDAFLGLASQGFRTSVGQFNCLYRGPKGLKCAIGHCIPDDVYRPEMDMGNHTGFKDNPSVQAVIRELYQGVDFDLVRRLQDVHDNADSPGDMKAWMISYAETYGLEVPA